MRRREFIALASAAAAWSSAAHGQARPLIGVLRVNGKEVEQFADTFRRDMSRLGWDDGQNVDFAFEFASGRTELLPKLARQLAARQPAMIVAFGNAGVRVVQGVTSTIPIIGMTDDLVGNGLAASMSRPGGNTTGVSIFGSELDVKRLELLHEFAPHTRRIGILHDPTATASSNLPRLRQAAAELGVEVVEVGAQTPEQIAAAVEQLRTARVDGVNVLASPVLNASRRVLVARMRDLRLAAIYEWPETAEEGGLLGYGARITLCYRHVAVLADKVLHGANPGDLPIEQPTVFTLVVNAAAAKGLGLAIPPSFMLRAEVID
jgi:putative tryptophan/tyrosine transport system substrate-binding protein